MDDMVNAFKLLEKEMDYSDSGLDIHRDLSRPFAHQYHLEPQNAGREAFVNASRDPRTVRVFEQRIFQDCFPQIARRSPRRQQ